jgi:hypothetical protein
MNVPNSPEIFERIVDEKYPYKDVWERLANALDYAKTHRIKHNKFHKKIHLQRIKHFSDLNANVRDDEFESTGAQYIKLPDNFTRVTVNEPFMRVVEGASFDAPYFRSEATRQFTEVGALYKDEDPVVAASKTKESCDRASQRNYRDLLNYLYSAATYVNLRVDEIGCKPITNFQLLSFNWKWPKEHEDLNDESSPLVGAHLRENDQGFIPASEYKRLAEYNKFEVRVCKVAGQVVIEAEVWQDGRVFVITSSLDDNGKLGDPVRLG